MTPETISILARIESLNGNLYLFRHSEDYMRPNNWTCEIKISHESSELKTKAAGPSLDAAVTAAWAKISPIIDTLAFAKSFEIPLLTLDHSPDGDL